MILSNISPSGCGNLEELTSYLNSYYEGSRACLDTLENVDYCVVKNEGNWYRAEVMERGDGQVNLYMSYSTLFFWHI